MTDLIQVPFQGATIACAIIDGRAFVALRPLCDAMELDWANQMRVVKRDPVLASIVVDLTTVGADGKRREMLCLPLDYLNGWLFRLDAGRYKPSDPRRERIIAYQRECYQALRDHFQGGAPSPRPLPPCRPWESTAQAGRAEKLVGKLRRIARNRHIGRTAMHAAVELACYGEADRADGPIAHYLLERLPQAVTPSQPQRSLPC